MLAILAAVMLAAAPQHDTVYTTRTAAGSSAPVVEETPQSDRDPAPGRDVPPALAAARSSDRVLGRLGLDAEPGAPPAQPPRDRRLRPQPQQYRPPPARRLRIRLRIRLRTRPPAADRLPPPRRPATAGRPTRSR